MKKNSELNVIEPNLSEFYQWFAGFSDGESSFQIHVRYNEEKTKVLGVGFWFTISLHIDDLSVLEFIKNKLEIGNIIVRNTRPVCDFTVTNKEGLYKLISIFDKYNLNTTKYFDYLDFRKAFILYHERAKNLSKENKDILISQILELKNKMNSQRTDINMPAWSDKINITKNWLLGFIEGEGSFFISRTDIEPGFSIELSSAQSFLLEKIQEFLVDSLGFDKYSLYKLINTSSNVISINKQKTRDSVILKIQNINVLNNYLVPYLRTMKFHSKKGKDFLDYQLICEAVYKGSHKLEDIRGLILRLSYTMNSYRLSSKLDNTLRESQPLSQKERDIIFNALPTIERLGDGRLREIDTGKVTINRSLLVYEVIKPNGEVLIFDSLNDVLKGLDVGFRTLKRHINEESWGDWNEFREYKIRRVPVFIGNAVNVK